MCSRLAASTDFGGFADALRALDGLSTAWHWIAYQTLGGRPGGVGGSPAPYQQAQIDLALFDLEGDPGETANVADQHPEVVAKMKELADGMRAELGDSATKQKGSGAREPGRLEEGDLRFDWKPGQPVRAGSAG